MIPRGEVGLIFATIGLQQAVFGENVYASVLVVVLATTLMTPPLLRLRLLRVNANIVGAGHESAVDPVGRTAAGRLVHDRAPRLRVAVRARGATR